MNKKFEAFDVSEDDFSISKRSVLMLLDQLIEEYSDFTNDVSPKNWRTTGHHITELKNMKSEIEEKLSPITVEEKEIEWVKDARKEDHSSKKDASTNAHDIEKQRISGEKLDSQLRNQLLKTQSQMTFLSNQARAALRSEDRRSKISKIAPNFTRENMKHIKKFEGFENNISHISELKIGDIIYYQGSKCEVLTEDDFSVRIKSLQTDREFTINQSQLQENGLRFA